MRWRQGRRSENVEDRRGERRASGAGVRIGGGLGGIVVLLLAFVLLGPEQAMNLLQQNGGAGVGVGDGPAPARAPSTWPGTDLANDAGWRTLTSPADQ